MAHIEHEKRKGEENSLAAAMTISTSLTLKYILIGTRHFADFAMYLLAASL